MDRIIPLYKPTLGPEEKEAIMRVMDSGWIAAGKETDLFEKEFAEVFEFPLIFHKAN